MICSLKATDWRKLRVERDGETQLLNVDLVETFNWLLGLRVQKVRVVDGYHTVEGTDPSGEQVLVIWRGLMDAGSGSDDEALRRFFVEQGYGSRPEDTALKRIYVNGDCTLASLRQEADRWAVLLTEEAFKRLTFATAPDGTL